MSETITKRLHVSGLTPSITPTDLSQRFSSFGTVKALDGFGKLDGVGLPRKFGYVTIETTKGQLSKCMNLLSGVTWKGARLRIGEAKPDYAERLKRERDSTSDDSLRPRKRVRGVQGTHAHDMSLVTPENVSERKAWHLTPTGRMIRPLRMRLARPLPEPIEAKTNAKGKGKGKEKRKKKKVGAEVTRARRRTIDPVRWDSVHLKGAFLGEGGGVTEGRSENVNEEGIKDQSASESESESEKESEEHQGSDDTEGEDTAERPIEQQPDTHQASSPVKSTTPAPVPATTSANEALEQEKSRSLGLLQSLFGDDDEWGGQESVDSDVDQSESDVSDDFEDQEELGLPFEAAGARSTDPEEHLSPSESDEEELVPPSKEANKESQKAQVQAPKLKDLFAPREEEAAFSLLGHLDIDLELDEELSFVIPHTTASDSARPAPPQSNAYVSPQIHNQIQTRSKPPPPSLDPSAPLFFPHPEPTQTKGKSRDLFDVFKEKGWDWRDAGFYRTQSSEEIRKRWEGCKVGLTREWKRRYREAVKSRRRRGGGGAEGDV